jgi:hypothetical protein
MATPDQHQLAIEYRELMQTIAKTETQVAALRRFAALPPETVAAVKDEASAVGRLAYEALEGTAARSPMHSNARSTRPNVMSKPHIGR